MGTHTGTCEPVCSQRVTFGGYRVVDGVVGADFLSAVKEKVESWSGEEG